MPIKQHCGCLLATGLKLAFRQRSRQLLICVHMRGGCSIVQLLVSPLGWLCLILRAVDAEPVQRPVDVASAAAEAPTSSSPPPPGTSRACWHVMRSSAGKAVGGITDYGCMPRNAMPAGALSQLQLLHRWWERHSQGRLEVCLQHLAQHGHAKESQSLLRKRQFEARW